MKVGKEIAVIGAGSYGTCLAILLESLGHSVSMWCRSEETAKRLESSRENSAYLPGYKLRDGLLVDSDLTRVVSEKQIVVAVTPSHAIRAVLSAAASALRDDAIVVNTSKGLEEKTLARVDEIYDDVLPAGIAKRSTFLSGPTFAKEVAAGMPSAMVVAGREQSSVAEVQSVFSGEKFRVYTSDDHIGVQLGGALKNVIAICAGISDGLGLGDNARAALITRGLAEITRMGVAMGANPLTFSGLSGMGDLVLTCAGDLSRNRRVGLALGRGEKLESIVEEMGGMVAEGVKTTRVAKQVAEKHKVESPLTNFAHGVIYEGLSASEGLRALLSRQLRPERG